MSAPRRAALISVMGEAMPRSYLVQERVDPVMRDYLELLDVRVVELFSWNELLQFLRAINPAVAAES